MGLGLFLFAFAAALGREIPWTYCESEHFELIGQLSRADAVVCVNELEHFDWACKKLFKSKLTLHGRTRVFIFATQRDLETFRSKASGASKPAAGLYLPGADGAQLVFSAEAMRLGENGNGNVFLHENAHRVLRSLAGDLPCWLDEGLAEYLSSMRFTEEGLEMGAPIRRRLDCLRRQRNLPPLAGLFAVGHESADYVNEDRQPLFYSEAWLLVATLAAVQEGPVSERLNGMLALCNKKADTLAEILRLTGRSEAGLAAAMRQRAAGGWKPVAVRLGVYDGPVVRVVREANRIERLCGLADLKWRLAPEDGDGLELFTLADEVPESPRPWEVLGAMAAQRERDRCKAEGYWERAVERGSRDPYVYVQLAREKLRTGANCQSLDYRAPAAVADPIRALLDQALSLDSDEPEAWEALAQLEAASDRPRPEVLAEVSGHLPGLAAPSGVLTALAVYEWRNGNMEASRRLLEQAGSAGPVRFDVQREMRRLRERLESAD